MPLLAWRSFTTQCAKVAAVGKGNGVSVYILYVMYVRMYVCMYVCMNTGNSWCHVCLFVCVCARVPVHVGV